MKGSLDWALEYIERGWSVIPIAPRSKAPPCGFELARFLSGELRITASVAKAWWPPTSTYGIGVLTGHVSGIIVADVDPRNGGDTELSMQFPTSCRAETGGGGRHLVYRLPYVTRGSGPSGIVGVDRKADGGYIVVEPSVHPNGRDYVWLEFGEPGSQVPDGLLNSPAPVQGEQVDGEPWVAATLAAPGACLPGSQDDTLAKLAWYFAGTDQAEDVTAATLRLWADGLTLTQGPFTDAQIQSKIDSAYAKRTPTRKYTGIINSSIEPAYVRVSDVETKPIDWLWPGRIPFNALAVIDGDPGISKSLLTLDLAATLSTGRPFYGQPEKEYRPANTLILSYEDDVATAIRPRLEAAGADLDRIFAFQLHRTLTLPSGADALCAAVQATEARLLIVDPIMAAIDSDYSANVDQEIRACMRPLIAFAAQYRVAVVLVRHLAKGSGQAKKLYRGMGSIGWAAMARAVFAVERKDKEVTFECIKSNSARLPDVLAYRVTSKGNQPCIEWLGAPKADEERQPTRDEEAADIIRKMLAAGPVLGADVRAMLGGFGEKAITTACKHLYVERGRGSNSVWKITLPGCHSDTPLEE